MVDRTESALSYYVPEDWKFIAGIDESEQYETDVTEIWHDGRSFHLLTASGCSCWAGDYDDETYPTLDELERQIGLDGDEDRMYNPTLKGAQTLMQRAWQEVESLELG